MEFTAAHFQIVKLGADILLVISVFYLAFRSIRSSLSAKTTELMILDSSLKGLIKDAESAGRTLNEELGGRQRALERILSEVEELERKVSNGLKEIEDSRLLLEKETKAARTVTADLARGVASTPRQAYYQGDVITGVPIIEEAPEPPSFDDGRHARRSAPQEERIAPQQNRTNIYGEPMEETVPQRASAVDRARAFGARTAKPLARAIEKEVMQPAPQQMEAADPLKNIFGAAEDLLRAGKNVEFVAAATRLPIERVRLIADTIPEARSQTIEVISDETPSADPRLGVLGAIRRSTQVL